MGNYIKGYGDNVKSSMSADGPVSAPAKKTAVKPSAPTAKPQTAQKALPSTGSAQKALPSTGGAQKALPSTGGAQKALSSATKSVPSVGGTPKTTPSKSLPVTGTLQRGYSGTSQKPQSTPKPAQQAPRPNTGGTQQKTQGVVSGAKGATGQKPGGPTNTRPMSTSKGPSAPSTASNTRSDGKVRISAASRPNPASSKPGARSTAQYTKTVGGGGSGQQQPTGGDILGIGDNYGDIGKVSQQAGNQSRQQGGQQGGQGGNQGGNQGGPPNKPNASDPLGMGEELSKIGQKS